MIKGSKSTQTNVKAVTPTDDEWEAIKGRMLNPDRFESKDVRVYKSWLANNYPDRSKERFSLGILKVFAKTLPGKSVLFNGHEWGPPGSGRWFDAKVVKVTKEQVLENIGFAPSKKFLKQLDAIDASEGLTFLEAKFYTLASNPATDALDAGIMRDMSIGFRADELRAVSDQHGNVEWKEYLATDKAGSEALEGSFVFLGDQYGAGAKKEFSQDEQGVEFMNLTFKSLGLAITVNPEDETSVKMLIEQVEAKCAAMTEEAKAAKAELDKFKAALGGDVTEEQAKKIAADAKAYAEQTVEEAVKFGAACGMIAKEKVDERRAELKAMPIDQVKVWLETYRKIWDDRNGAKGKLGEGDPADKGEEKAAKVLMPDSDY
jgi:hypothetical protein